MAHGAGATQYRVRARRDQGRFSRMRLRRNRSKTSRLTRALATYLKFKAMAKALGDACSLTGRGGVPSTKGTL